MNLDSKGLSKCIVLWKGYRHAIMIKVTRYKLVFRGENELIEDLSADLLSAVAPTPKSMYRTSGGYHNMAFSGRFNPENPVKSRRV